MDNLNNGEHLSDDQLKVGIKIINTSSWLLQFLSEILKPYKLTFPQYNVLRILQESGTAVSVKYIGNQMIDPNSNISRLVDKLVEKGLAKRLDSEIDKRVVNITITEKGMDAVVKAKESVYTQLGNKMKGYSSENLSELNAQLDKLKIFIQKS